MSLKTLGGENLPNQFDWCFTGPVSEAIPMELNLKLQNEGDHTEYLYPRADCYWYLVGCLFILLVSFDSTGFRVS